MERRMRAAATASLLFCVFIHSPVDAQTKITIGYAAMSPRTIPLILAQEQGIFAKHGLEARTVLIRGAPILVASLLSAISKSVHGGTAVVGSGGIGDLSAHPVVQFPVS